MSKPELGTKRVCPVTGRKFYDLNKDPIVSPYTGQIVPVSAAASRTRADVAPKPALDEEADLPESADAELVPLEEADADASGATPVAADDADEEDVELAQELDDDSSFLEESEDEDDDVADIIGGDIEDEEET